MSLSNYRPLISHLKYGDDIRKPLMFIHVYNNKVYTLYNRFVFTKKKNVKKRFYQYMHRSSDGLTVNKIISK